VSARARPQVRSLSRRRKPSVAARVRPFWILGVLGACVLVAAGVWFMRAPQFRVTRVGIDVPLGSPVSAADVRAAAAIGADANVWLLWPPAIARRIEALPYVDRASVHRGQFPAPFVELGVSMRRATSCLDTGNGEVTLDATARVLQSGCASPRLPRLVATGAALPAPGVVVSASAVQRLLADATTLADAGLSMRSLGWDRWGGLEGVDASGVVLRLGEDDDLAAKAALVGPVRAGIGSKRPLRAIDLRAPRTPTVEFR
jgi:hypothetical protein